MATRTFLTLKIFQGDKHLRNIPFQQKSFQIGANHRNDIVVEGQQVAPLHAAVDFRSEEEGYYIMDLGTISGTLVNGERVRTTRRLSDGDKIRIGKTDLVVRLDTYADEKQESAEATPTGEQIPIAQDPWREFIDSGLLWWVNRSLHVFGWALTYEETPDGQITKIYPAQVSYKGFTREIEEEGFAKMDAYFRQKFG